MPQSTQADPDHFFPAPQEIHAPELVLPAGEVVPALQEAQVVASVFNAEVAPARAYLPSIHAVMVPEQVADVRPCVDP